MQFLGLIQTPYVKHRTKPFDVLMTCKKIVSFWPSLSFGPFSLPVKQGMQWPKFSLSWLLIEAYLCLLFFIWPLGGQRQVLSPHAAAAHY